MVPIIPFLDYSDTCLHLSIVLRARAQHLLNLSGTRLGWNGPTIEFQFHLIFQLKLVRVNTALGSKWVFWFQRANAATSVWTNYMLQKLSTWMGPRGETLEFSLKENSTEADCRTWLQHCWMYLNYPHMFWPNTPNMTRCRHFSEEIHLQHHKKGWKIEWPEQRSSYCGTRCFIAYVSCSCFLFLSLSMGGCNLKSGKPTKWCGSKSLENKAKAAEKVSCFMISCFKHFKHAQNPQILNMKRTWRRFDRQLAQIFGCGVRLHDWRTSDRLMSKQRDHLRRSTRVGVTSWNEFTVQKVGIAKQSLLSSLGIGTPNYEQICSVSLVIFPYLANESNWTRTSNLGVHIPSHSFVYVVFACACTAALEPQQKKPT